MGRTAALAGILLVGIGAFAVGMLWREGPAEAQAAPRQQKVLFLPPLKESEPVVISAEERAKSREADAKSGTVSATACISASDCALLDLAITRGWRIASVHSSAAGFCIVLEK